MHQRDEAIVVFVDRLIRDATDNSGNNPVGDFSDDHEGSSNDRSLQVNVGPD